jgi:plastocyanin
VKAKSVVTQAVLAGILAAAIACGGSSYNPNNPGGGGGTPGTSGATITISSTGVVSPSSVTINPGESVTFVNNDSRGHEIASNPHPAHTDCPAINALGVIQAGQSKLTNALTTSRSCGFHDHLDDSNRNLQGTITVR